MKPSNQFIQCKDKLRLHTVLYVVWLTVNINRIKQNERHNNVNILNNWKKYHPNMLKIHEILSIFKFHFHHLATLFDKFSYNINSVANRATKILSNFVLATMYNVQGIFCF